MAPGRRPMHASNFSFGRSLQGGLDAAAADVVFWRHGDTVSSVDAGLGGASGNLRDTTGSNTTGQSVTLARRLDRNLSQSMPARAALRDVADWASFRGSVAAEPGAPLSPLEETSTQWEPAGTIGSGAASPPLPAGAQSSSRTLSESPESLHLADTLLPQPPASSAITVSAPLSDPASSSFLQEPSGLSGLSFRTAMSPTSSIIPGSPSADGGSAGGPWSLPGTSGALPAAARPSLDSRNSSVQSVVVHGSGSAAPPGPVLPPPRRVPPPIVTGPFVVPAGAPGTPREVLPAGVEAHRQSFSEALRDEFATAHSHLPGGASVPAASPVRSGVTVLDEAAEDAVQQLLQDMQLQVCLYTYVPVILPVFTLFRPSFCMLGV